MIRIVLAVLAVLGAMFAFYVRSHHAGNLIRPVTELSAFESAQTNGGTGTITSDGDAIRFDVTALPNLTEPNRSYVQVYQHKIALEQNTEYHIHFKAKASKFLKIRVAAGMAVRPFNDLGLSQIITVSPEWNDYDFRFKAVRTDGQPDNAPLFDLSYEPGTLWMKDLTMTVAD